MSEDKLLEFQKFLQDISGVNVLLGDVDVGGNDLPVWTVDFNEDWELKYMSNAALDVNFNLNCVLWVGRKNSIQALQIMIKTLKSINTFDKAQGAGIGTEFTANFSEQSATVSTEITTNNIKLSFPFRINSKIQE